MQERYQGDGTNMWWQITYGALNENALRQSTDIRATSWNLCHSRQQLSFVLFTNLFYINLSLSNLWKCLKPWSWIHIYYLAFYFLLPSYITYFFTYFHDKLQRQYNDDENLQKKVEKLSSDLNIFAVMQPEWL